MVGISTLVLFFFSSLRHSLFHSGAWDLGIFDQAVYLISQGVIPNSSFTDFHILGDHAAFILYPLSLLYRIYPDVHWLFLIQAIALSSGAIPVFYLARQQKLNDNLGHILSLVYLLSPLIFNANLFDFHPDAIAVPSFLWAVLWARLDKLLHFCIAVVIVLSCKAVFSLTVIAMGIWLFLFEKKLLMGSLSIVAGIVWFVIATKIIIPAIGGESASTARHITRYISLGSSYSEIFTNFFTKPNLFFNKVFSIDSFTYLLLLFAPFIWCWRSKNLSPLIATIPTITMSILSDDPAQRYLANQYPLPILPFLMLIAISNLSIADRQKKWNLRFIVFWAALVFILMSRLNLFTWEYLDSLDTWKENNEAIALVKDQGSILTTHEIAPHVTHRLKVETTLIGDPSNLDDFDYVLLNVRYPGFGSNHDYSVDLVEKAKKIQNLQLEYQKNDVYLFAKK
ncbi:MAG: hypothetical protein DCF19_00470 [Pseudanabaena frigida]|uniref:DUF2079 domain-containing protein n=1 Tax=Pseudanabaena frigida TaxID=945775 RepID=A0A2W4YEG5_9CYAN|nr:MAG: hypothetical protein DCF19_00470 [Pseudanabaena frigida]